MQYQSIKPDPKRDADAVTLAETAPWPIYTLKVAVGAFPAGTVFYRVPSRSNPDRRWLANGVACQCPDYMQRGAMCAHTRAVRLHEARSAAPTTPLARYEELVPTCQAQGCQDDPEPHEDFCHRHVLVDAF